MLEQTKQLLDYIDTQEDAILIFNTSGMKLAAHSDASYLSELQTWSQTGGYISLSSNSTVPPNTMEPFSIWRTSSNML